MNSRLYKYGQEGIFSYGGIGGGLCLYNGKTAFEYDFKGNVIKQEKQFAENFDTQIDWNGQTNLLNEIFTTETEYDALNRPKSIVNPDNTTLYYGYDKGGMLDFVQRGDNEVHISNIEYNEKGQRLNIYYGNNTKTRYYYNDKNFRLIRILTTRNNGQDILQDLNYTFDAVGNIIEQTDNAQQTHYFDNQVIAPTGRYEYDALYRLIKATGRELTALTAPTHEDFANDVPVPNPAGNAMQNYTHNYQYDALGNMLHDAWKEYVYDTDTNRLMRHDIEQTTDDYTYDEHGNMLAMPHLNDILWNCKDEMTSATNGTFTSYYNYDSSGNRTRKTVVKGNVTETRYYINGYEVYRKHTNQNLDFERTTLNISDDEKVFVRVEQETEENEIIRYQYDNHLGSACLELDFEGDIISYEEYHPFGTTSYRSGRSEIEVSTKRYKYNGKERDEETGLYAYGMRYYAAWICRFVSVDPLQFEYPYYTPFQYAGNKPITFIDLDGGEPSQTKMQTRGLPTINGKTGPWSPAAIKQAEANANSNTQKKTPTVSPLPKQPTTQAKKIEIAVVKADQVATQSPKPTSITTIPLSPLEAYRKEKFGDYKPPQNTGIIYQTPSNLEKWCNLMIAPEVRTMIQFDPFIRSVAVGGLTVTGGLFAKEVVTGAATDVISATPKITETAIKVYEIYQSPWGQRVTGFGLGLYNEMAHEFLPPDMLFPSLDMQAGAGTGVLS